ncbi:MAG: hypothetical protein QME12_05265 [Nanoarchaeota archaeon]|nr:hypothetical protein [Nanoarchaeota archaeon]
MKKIIVIMLAFALLLTACAQQKAAETAMPAVPESSAEAPAIETPEAPAAETNEEPVALIPAEEEPAAAPKEETPAHAPETDEMNYEVNIGDEIKYKDTAFSIDNIANSGNELYLNFNAYILKLKGLNKPEILNDVAYKIASNANYVKDHTVTLNVQPFKLGKNQYLIMKDKSVNVNGTTLLLGDVKMDTNGLESAYFYIKDYEYWIKLKQTVDATNLSVTLDSAFHQQKKYAILTIVPR